MSGGPILYPNVTSLPGQSGVAPGQRPDAKPKPGEKGEFEQVFDRALGSALPELPGQTDLSQVRAPLKFSAHAMQRLNDRKIKLEPETLAKVNEAIDKAAGKGIEDTLVLTKDAALIVSVKNRTVITALDRNSLSGNVFTNIDGAVVI